MALVGKKIIIAVTGSIAAYKTPHLVRLLVKAGAEVKVIATHAALSFVTPLSLSTVSKNPVLTDVHDGNNWHHHVALGLWADVMIIAPATANSLAKLANGICDNIVAAVYLSARCPVFFAPAMDEDMWRHPSTQRNITTLGSYGNKMIPVAHGELASGLVGDGRMAEPENIVTTIANYLSAGSPLAGMRALVTAGPTYERIDPVRYIGNFSTGKMGIAIADELALKGAQVTLICGPTHVRAKQLGVTTIAIESAEEMYAACMQAYPTTHIAVMAAAVADYKPQITATQKIKKHGEEQLTLELVKNNDILQTLGEIKQPWQTLVGFALETEHELANAEAKLQKKNADVMVLNSLQDDGAGFGHDTNKVTILTKSGSTMHYPLQTKQQVAEALVNLLIEKTYVEVAN
jgi:phosphopantothenoylcysteine decarboxylase / phosphopantothenate---cysteine ligase